MVVILTIAMSLGILLFARFPICDQATLKLKFWLRCWYVHTWSGGIKVHPTINATWSFFYTAIQKQDSITKNPGPHTDPLTMTNIDMHAHQLLYGADFSELKGTRQGP